MGFKQLEIKYMAIKPGIKMEIRMIEIARTKMGVLDM